jgi:hypothetical protein
LVIGTLLAASKPHKPVEKTDVWNLKLNSEVM